MAIKAKDYLRCCGRRWTTATANGQRPPASNVSPVSSTIFHLRNGKAVLKIEMAMKQEGERWVATEGQ